MKNRFPLPLLTEHLDGRRFRLIAPFIYVVTFNPYEEVVVPIDFITDLASIPKMFWWIIGSPNGRYGKPSVIHDNLYAVQIYTRQRSDEIFYDSMQEAKVSFWRRWIMYHAVRTCGWMPWNRYRKNNNGGKK